MQNSPSSNLPLSGDQDASRREPIAIVGIGCRFPGDANGPEAFWQALQREVDAIVDVPEDRWRLESFYDPNPDKAGKIKSRKGGFLQNVDHFDADFFGIFPAEAGRIDPQQRLLLEVTYETLEDAGTRLEDFSGSRTGVYMGVFMNDYWDIQASILQRDQISPHVPMGVSLTAIANRLSYVYNLKGPSLTLDTACSSSLVAVHLACRSIWSGESTQALAGGVNLILRPESSIMMSKGGFLSPDGYCKSFDSRANGYVRSEGCGVVLLKPLSRAEADGDHVYALIRGSAVNQDGRTEEGFTVPSAEAQTDMLRTAYRDAGVDPTQVSFVEAHGTGTPVGDPIETKAFGAVFGEHRPAEDVCVIGSVKSNIGHLEAAAGIAGLIKLSLALKHQQIPANLHFLTPNPSIPFHQYKLRVPTTLEPWPSKPHPAFGGVNSFGAGGTNAHVVMQAYSPTGTDGVGPGGQDSAEDGAVQLFTVSARSPEALKALTRRYVDFLGDPASASGTEASLRDLCFSAGTRRSAHPYRLAVATGSKGALKESLEAFLVDETRPGMTYHKATPGHQPKVGFIFSGQGPQWFAMGQQLMQSSPVFRDVIHRIDAVFSRLADWSLLTEMNRDEATSRVSETRIAQPAIMAVQIGLSELWKSWGVTPEGCVGHSIGEVAAAYTAGALTLEQAVEVIYHRSRGQDKATGKGQMLAVGLPLDAVRKAIQGLEAEISVAAINGPAMVTLSGNSDPLAAVAAALDEQHVFHRFLKVNVPFHSHHMEPLKDELIASLAHLTPRLAHLPLYSTVTGKRENGEHLVSQYWYQNVREPVYFTDALQRMVDDGFDTFVEIAPHPVLADGADELLQNNRVKNALLVPSLRRKEDEALTMAGSLGKLLTHGYAVDWRRLCGPDARFVKLPGYAWQSERHWFETEAHRQQRIGRPQHPFLKSGQQSVADPGSCRWDVNLDPAVFPYLADHRVEGTLIFPGTGHLEVAQAAARASFPGDFVFLEDIRFEAALFLAEEGEAPEVRLEVVSDEGNYLISSRPRAISDPSKSEEGTDVPWTKHSRGKINHLGDRFVSVPVDLVELQQRVNRPVSVADFYVELKECGLQYGESFRRVQKLWRSEGEILAALSLHSDDAYGVESYHFHPALLDACLHTIFAAKESTGDQKRGIYLPVHIDRFKVHRPSGTRVWCYVQTTLVSDEYLQGNYWIVDEQGQLVAEIQGLRCKYIEGSRGEQKNDRYQGTYEYQWSLLPAEAVSTVAVSTVAVTGATTDEGYLIFADEGGLGDQLIDRFRADGIMPVVVKRGTGFLQSDRRHFAVDAANRQHLGQVFQTLAALGIVPKRVVYLWSLDSRFDDQLTTEQLEAQQRELSTSLLNSLRAVVESDLEPAVFLITQGVEAVVETDQTVNINQAAVYGTGRVMRNEYPFIPLRLIDVSADCPAGEPGRLYAELTAVATQPPIVEMALRGDRWYGRKLAAVTEEGAEAASRRVMPALGSPYRASVKEYGTLDGVVFRTAGRPALGADEMEIQVRAAGLNFKDVMNVMGLLTDEAVEGGVAGKNLGLECAGVVTAVGDDVREFAVGDEVMAWAAHSFAGYTRARTSCAVRKPTTLTFEEAATVTVVYLTAYYSLHYLGRVGTGDRVLIHAAAGGVGLAAIQLAQLAGAEVLATAGNEEKRRYLRSLGIQHVFDSRSLGFADEVAAATGGQGVDLVLNSLTGKGVTQSIKCLAPFGKFIEIGKADIYGDARLALRRFGNNLSYHAVDLDRLMQQKPKLGQGLYRELAALFQAGKLTALPPRTYPVAELAEALGYLSKGVHTGKVAVVMDERPVPVLPAAALALSANGTYLVTGGASGFGLELGRWLAEKGAGNLALLSRSGVKSDGDRQTVEALRQRGVRVELFQVDITCFAEVRQVLGVIRASMPPLKGIVHSAAVLDDATLPNMDEARFTRVFNPKALGAWNLHRATQELYSLDETLDFFLMLSSISAIFGLPGQANYSSANNFLDKLAHYRQSKGLAASSVNLGVLGLYAGMSKEGGQVLNVLANQGWLPLSLRQVTDKVETILLQQPAQRMAANLDWRRFREFFTHLVSDTRFAHFLSDGQLRNQGAAGNGTFSLIDQATALPVEQQAGFLQEKLVESLAKILGTSAGKIDADVSIAKIGMDSLMLNQFRNWIQQKLEINYPLMKIAKGPSIRELAAQLLLESGRVNAPSPDGRTPDGRTEVPVRVDGLVDTSGIATEEDLEVIADKWLVRNRKNAWEPQVRIFCIHPVGAGATLFSHFIYHPPVGTEVLAFQLPGRENRLDEPSYEDVPALVAEMARAILPLLDRPFIVLGHSFGGIVGFELIRYLRRHHGLTPMHLFVTGTIAPQLTRNWKKRDVISETAITSNSEEKLLALMNHIDDVAFLKRILPVMRKDMPLIMRYVYQEEVRFDFPITGFAGDKDEVVSEKEVGCWREQTDGEFSMELVEGDHWFLSRNRDLILSRLSEALAGIPV
ncbi:MAG: SDR family NAD(P)-dependent oxidoreductase [Ferruginibacter sp.]|nr:SDR family NAD(P)-dependent oxidoreductase [Cytophagales bacterium]